MKKIIPNKLFKNYISFLIPLFALEVLFRILSNMAIIDWALFRIFISCNILSLILSVTLSFFKEKTGNIISSIILFIITIYTILEAGFKNFLGVYMSFGTSSQLGAVKEYIKDYIDSFNPWFYTMLIPFIIYLIYKIFFEQKLFLKNSFKKNNRFQQRKNNHACITTIIITIVLCLFYYATLSLKWMQNELQLESTISLFKNPTNLNISVNQFGTTVFSLLDIKTLIFKPKEEDISFYQKQEKVEVTDYTRTIDDTNWLLLNEETENKNYKTLNNYFMSRTITDKNEYTGMFEGKNLIMIMMESVDEIFINPEYYPTFYKLYTEGWSFNNNYSPRNSCATMNNEMSGLISLYSIYRNCTANVYQNNEYFESVFNLFNNAGYKTSSYHNYDETYYARSTIHKNMGSNAFYGVKDLGISYKWVYEEWPSDILLMERAMEHIETSKPFMTWMTTVTSHQPYSVSSEFGDKYLSLFKDTNYTLAAKRYMSKLKELDLALEKLLTLLEEKGVLDDTVIVLFGDHYPYGLDKTSISGVLGSEVLEKNNIEKTPLVIYNSQLEPKTFNQYTSYMNLLPTIANLFNFDYDPRLYMGEDILSDTYINSYKNRVVFADGSWENDIGYYDVTNGSMTYFGEETYTNEQIIAYNQEIRDMIKMSNLAITSNYFKYLSDGLKKYSEVIVKENNTTTETSE